MPTVASCIQKVEAGARSATIPVTYSRTAPAGVCSDSRVPGCRPNRYAICVVAATPTAPAGTLAVA